MGKLEKISPAFDLRRRQIISLVKRKIPNNIISLMWQFLTCRIFPVALRSFQRAINQISKPHINAIL